MPKNTQRGNWDVDVPEVLAQLMQDGEVAVLKAKGRDYRAMPRSSDVYPRKPKGTCRVCLKRIPRGSRRLYYCDATCVRTFVDAGNWGALRRSIFERDQGVCCGCGLDIAKAKKQHRADRPNPAEWGEEFPAAFAAWRAWGRIMGAWFNCDHIKPCCEWPEGSNPHVRENLRTLCVPCHKKITKQQATERAARRASRP